jgi:asparagine synthase (glutamine-hydrolysing)
MQLLMKQDKMSMAASIESRVPLLDHKLVEFCAALPSSLKLRGMTGKYLFKRAMEGTLPSDIIYRKKMGFPVPLKKWLGGSCHQLAREILLDSSSDRGYFDRSVLQTMLNQQASGVHDWTDQIWTLMNLELWMRTFIDGNAPLPALNVKRSEAMVS